MTGFAIGCLAVAGALLLAGAGYIVYFLCSPMPVVKRLRKGPSEEPVELPGDAAALLARVTVQRDLVYPSDYGKNTLDLYLPKDAKSAPLVLWVHGGAFVAGDKNGVKNWGVTLAANGYAVAAMNYEWAPEAPYPAPLFQIADALRFLQKHAAAGAPLDMERLAFAGDSAGAHMAAQAVLLATNPAFSERLGIALPIAKTALRCALLYCGPYDLERMFGIKNRVLRLFISRIGWSYFGRRDWKNAPLLDTVTVPRFVTRDYVPTYITDGNTFSFESHGRALGARLREVGVKTAERYFDKAQFGEVTHEYQLRLHEKNAQDCLADTLQFLAEAMGEART